MLLLYVDFILGVLVKTEASGYAFKGIFWVERS